jgi:transcriptional regulator with XRE-family HTH domain
MAPAASPRLSHIGQRLIIRQGTCFRLAAASQVAKATIANFELGKRAPYARTLDDLCAALEAAGVEFTNGDRPGVRLRKKN